MSKITQIIQFKVKKYNEELINQRLWWKVKYEEEDINEDILGRL